MSSEKNQTRERILKSTWSLLEAEGGSKVRMADIAKAAKVSRQAVYLHFPNRAELLTATTRYLDEVFDIDARLQKSRAAKTGIERLHAWVAAWGDYIPLIYGVARAIMAMKDSDAEAMVAWNDRMQAVREGAEAAVEALEKDGALREGLSVTEATDMLWALQSVEMWEILRHTCNWSQERYIEHIKDTAVRMLVQ
jgi:AcrR family transcriptional regulator